MPNVKQSRGFQEIRKKILGSMTVEERLDGVTPEDLLAGLPPEKREQLAALLAQRNTR